MFLPKIDLTQFQYLSASIQEKFQNITETELFSLYQELSGQPLDGYERKKIELFGEEFKFPTINDIEVPDNFNLKACLDCLSAEQRRVSETTIQEISSLSSIPLTGLNLTPDEKMFKNIILASEFGKTLTVEEINRDPIRTAQKVLTFVTNIIKN